MIAPRTKGRVYLQSFMDALVTFSAFWAWLFVFILVEQVDSREQLDALGAALFYSMVALTAVMLQGFRTIKSRPEWWSPMWRESSRLAASQVLWVAVALVAAMLAVGDRATSRLFLGSWMVLLYGCLLVANRFLPAKIIQTVYEGRKERALLVLNGVPPEGLQTWRERQEKNGVDSSEYDTQFTPGEMVTMERIMEERNVTQVLLMAWPEGEVLERLRESCTKLGVRLLVCGEVPDGTWPAFVRREEAGLQVYDVQELTNQPLR